jgi:hypothetical protein
VPCELNQKLFELRSGVTTQASRKGEGPGHPEIYPAGRLPVRDSRGPLIQQIGSVVKLDVRARLEDLIDEPLLRYGDTIKLSPIMIF